MSFFFTVSFNMASADEIIKEETMTIEVKLEKFKGSAKIGEDCFIDGKIKASITAFSGERISFDCRGSIEKAGFLMAGSKYISKNQPIKIHTNSSYFEGRVCNIIHH